VDRVFPDANVLFSAAYRADAGLVVLAALLPEGLVLPPDDQVIFLAAMAARATHLLTGDRIHFGPYYGRTIAGVLVLPPSVYLRG
jgi:hypothetical protein